MSIEIIERALEHLNEYAMPWSEECSWECVDQISRNSSQLNIYKLESAKGQRGFLRTEVFQGGELYMTYMVPVGVVETPSAAAPLLLQNRLGLKESQFYFTISKEGDDYVVWIEASVVDRAAEFELVCWRISNWWGSDVWMTTWHIPDGVRSIHPRYSDS